MNVLRETRVSTSDRCPGFTARIKHDLEGLLPYLVEIDVDDLAQVHVLSEHKTLEEALDNFNQLVKKAPAMLEAHLC